MKIKGFENSSMNSETKKNFIEANTWIFRLLLKEHRCTDAKSWFLYNNNKKTFTAKIASKFLTDSSACMYQSDQT